MSSIKELKHLYEGIYSEGIAAEHPDIAGQHEFAKKADKEIARRRKEREKKAGPQLPSFVKTVRKEEAELDEAHYNPVTKKIQDKPVSRDEIESLAAKARTKKKARKPLGSIRKNSASFTPSSPEQAKADKKAWDEYWEGSWKNKTQKEGLEIDEEMMTAGDKKKEKQLKKKYDKSGMKASMIKQYGPEKGKQVYFATIRKQAMEQLEHIDEMAPMVAAGLAAGGAALAGAAINKARQAAKSGVDAANKGMKVNKPSGISGAAYNIQKRNNALKNAMGQLNQSFDYEDAYEYIIETLVSAEFAESYESAERMFAHISDKFTSAILEEYIEEKARGTRKKTTVHAYDVDETLFGHGKKGKPNVQVHVKDASGKRVKSLSNQEFNTHKLDKGHSYDFSEFQSAKKFKETSSPNKKVIKDIKRKQARGQNVHLITARSKFDNPSEFQGHLKKHGINVDKKNIHYTGGMKGGDIGKKKVDVANAVAKQSGAKKIHMYDDAAKVHKAFEKEKKEAPTSKKIKTHMVAPDKKGEARVRSYQATKNEEMSSYEYWKQFIK